MMNQANLDTLHAARRVLETHGFDTSQLDAHLQAVEQANEDERLDRQHATHDAGDHRRACICPVEQVQRGAEGLGRCLACGRTWLMAPDGRWHLLEAR